MKYRIAKIKKNTYVNYVLNFSFLMYFCAIFAHLTYGQGNAIDRYIVYISCILIIMSTYLKLLMDLLSKRYVKLVKLHTVWYGIFACICILSYNWALNDNYVINILKPIVLNLISSFCLMYYIKRKSDLIKIFRLIIISSIYLSIRAITTTSFINYRPGMLGENIGLNHNGIALILAFSSILSLYLYYESNKIKYIIVNVIFFIIILISGSRKSLLIFICGYGMFIFIDNFKSSIYKILRNIIISVSIIIILYFLITKNEFLYNIIGERIFTLIKSLSGDINSIDPSILERKFFRETAINLFLQRPISGWGIHNFAAYMEYIGYNHIAYSHNNHLELLADIGIVGYISYYIMYIYILFITLKNIIKKDRIYILGFIIMFLFIVFEYGFVTYYEPSFQVYIMCMVLITNKKIINKI